MTLCSSAPRFLPNVSILPKAHLGSDPAVAVGQKAVQEGLRVAEVGTNTADAAQLVADYGIVPKAEVAEKALPACNIVYIAGDEMKADLSGYLQVLYDADAASVGGAMPGDDFYYGAA